MTTYGSNRWKYLGVKRKATMDHKQTKFILLMLHNFHHCFSHSQTLILNKQDQESSEKLLCLFCVCVCVCIYFDSWSVWQCFPASDLPTHKKPFQETRAQKHDFSGNLRVLSGMHHIVTKLNFISRCYKKKTPHYCCKL